MAVRAMSPRMALPPLDQRAVHEERRPPGDGERDRKRRPEEEVANAGIQRAGPDEEHGVVDDLHRRDRERVGDERDADRSGEGSPCTEQRNQRQQVAEEEREQDREGNRRRVAPAPPGREHHAEDLSDPAPGEAVVRRADCEAIRAHPHDIRLAR
jgi:hypothetical protein